MLFEGDILVFRVLLHCGLQLVRPFAFFVELLFMLLLLLSLIMFILRFGLWLLLLFLPALAVLEKYVAVFIDADLLFGRLPLLLFGEPCLSTLSLIFGAEYVIVISLFRLANRLDIAWWWFNEPTRITDDAVLRYSWWIFSVRQHVHGNTTNQFAVEATEAKKIVIILSCCFFFLRMTFLDKFEIWSLDKILSKKKRYVTIHAKRFWCTKKNF